MSTSPRRATGFFANAFEIFGAAVNAAAAVRNHRRPDNGTLRTLGIDPASFPSTREF